jgi:hypothetical protein
VRLFAPALAATSLALAVAAHAAAKPAATAGPTVDIQPNPAVATVDFKWVFGIKVMNPLDVGLYPDSISIRTASWASPRISIPARPTARAPRKSRSAT